MSARKASRGRVSEHLVKEEEEKKTQRKLMDERELRKLGREARVMRDAKLKDATVEKNTKVKDILVQENDYLMDNLALMRSKSRCRQDTKKAQNIANLFAKGDDLDDAIALEKNYIKDLESQIEKDKLTIQAVKKKKGTVITSSEYLQKKEMERADRTLESWKSKLAAEQAQLAQITRENEEMRNKLRKLLKEKGQFNQLFEELMAKLTKGKRIMADVVDQSRQEFQKRSEVTRKITALRNRDKADLAKRMEEMQDLEKRLCEDTRLAEFRYRVQMCREKMVDGMRQSHKDTLEQTLLTKRLEKVTDFWTELKNVTGLKSADEISNYIMNEESSLFSLFKFNTEIRAQLEVLTQKTSALVNTVDDEQAGAEDRFEAEIRLRNTMIKKLELMEHNCNDINDHCDANSRLFSRLLDKIKILFELMKCKRSVLKDLLGNNKEVTEHNYRLYLGLVESEVIGALESVRLAFPPLPKQSANKTLSVIVSNKSLTRVKSTTSIVDRKVISLSCWECEGIAKLKFF